MDESPQYVRGYRGDEDGKVVAAEPYPFGMILIPGDAAQGVASFYLGETEVTWGIMESWIYCRDIETREELDRLIAAGLRPSGLYGDAAVQLHVFEPDYPAAGVTRHSAEQFCDWLSEKTGRRYRLPTPAEWARALKLSGGCPADPDEILKQAVFYENSEDVDDLFYSEDDPDGYNLRIARPVTSMEPNAMGFHHLLGNAAEWVVEPDGPAYLMGGHYALSAAEMSADWTDAEDHDVWNATYLNRPYSRFWYSGENNHQGFRLVCEVPE